MNIEGLVSGGDSPSIPAALITLTFTASDWSTPQTVTVTGQDDSETDGNQTFTINTAAAVSADSDYSGIDPDDVSAINNDDEAVVTGTLPDTGQTTSYTSTFGEDSDYTINPPSYTDNGDGTVTDNVTGLMWQQEDDNNFYNWYEATGTADATYNPGGATDVCGSVTTGGYTDWRLPGVQELTTILDLELPYPAIDVVNFPNTNYYSSGYYWSATTLTLTAYPTSAWSIDFFIGYTNTYYKFNSFYVRCVRDGQFNSSPKNFIDNGDNTVTDNGTGLVWQQGEGGFKNWESALTYCEGLSLGGNTDWRLPNYKELQSLVDYGRFLPALDITYFPGAISLDYSYSSSTINAFYPSNLWVVSFLAGKVSHDTKTGSYVRCVRSGQ